MDRQEASKLVYMALAAFPQLQGREAKWDETATLWSMVMVDVPYQYGQMALIEVLKTARFFPTPGEVRDRAIQMRHAQVARQPLAEIEAQERALADPESKKRCDAAFQKLLTVVKRRSA